MNLPNKISLVRICMIPVFIACFYITKLPYRFVISAVVFCLAALTDALDGHIARSRNLVTNLGKFLDPIADKVLVAVAFILMLTEEKIFGAFFPFEKMIASVCICVILGRELIISAFRQIAATSGIVLAAEKIGKFKTTFQDLCIAWLLVGANLEGTAYTVIHSIGLGFFAVATILTIVSGISYIVKNKQVLQDTEK